MAKESDKPSVKILVCGSTGAFRSHICNGIIGEELLEEQSQILEIDKKWEDDVNNIAISITNIAAYDNILHDENGYKEEITKIGNQSFDLFLYCLPVKVARPSIEDDKNTIAILKELLHQDVWKHCIVVLTYADSIVIRSQIKHNTQEISRQVKRDYNADIRDWTSAVQRDLFNGEAVRVVAAGSPECVSILNDGEFWLSMLFLAVHDEMDENPIKILILKNCNRLTESVPSIESIQGLSVHQQPIIISHKWSKLKERIKETLPGIGAGTTAGLVGATVGGLTGGLAIGVPSFGVFASTGMATGALVGGGIAAGTAVGVQKLASKQKKIKQEGLM